MCIYIYIYIRCRLPLKWCAGVGLRALCRPVQNSDSELSFCRLTLVCRCWVSPGRKNNKNTTRNVSW